MHSPSDIVLVTGGTGFAGSHLVEFLSESTQTQLHVTSFSGKREALATDSAEIHQVDLTDKKAVFELFEKVQPTHIYQLASFAFVGESFDRADEVLNNNTAVQLNVLQAMKELAPKSRFLAVSSAEVYGLGNEDGAPIGESDPFRPINPYAVSKVTQDVLAHAYFVSYGLDIVIVRPFNHIGERQSEAFVVPAFASQIVAIERGEQEALRVGSLEAERDFTDVKDMVKAYALAMVKGESGSAYNIGSGQAVSIREVLEQLVASSFAQIKVETDPSRMRPLDIPKMVADNGKIAQLGWQPSIPLKDTLERVMEWSRSKS